MSRQSTKQEIQMTARLAAPTNINPDHETIEALAYELWLRRGCPPGSDQEDWYGAEIELRSRTQSAQRAA